jgi:hypothetical protein
MMGRNKAEVEAMATAHAEELEALSTRAAATEARLSAKLATAEAELAQTRAKLEAAEVCDWAGSPCRSGLAKSLRFVGPCILCTPLVHSRATSA